MGWQIQGEGPKPCSVPKTTSQENITSKNPGDPSLGKGRKVVWGYCCLLFFFLLPFLLKGISAHDSNKSKLS